MGAMVAANKMLKVERVPVEQLVTYPGNARVHNLAAITDSLMANGQYRPLVVQRSTGYVLAGNGTLTAARGLGWAKVDVVYADVDDATAGRIVLADNRTNDLAAYDEGALLELLRPYEGALDGTAYDMDAFEDLLARNGASVLPVEDFAGGYAESQGETERRRNTGVALASQGFKEVILVLRSEQLVVFQDHIGYLQDIWETDSTTETVIKALNLVRATVGSEGR
jgi:hypothetical protein